ncbi:MAG: serine/threonine protein kinase, partial [Sandaracinaceae bacterium]|nr:serine/threonine protein kinase [Sandaracinaceae bacterium]
MLSPRRVGRYELLGPVGTGGMGEVHRARAFGAAGVVKHVCLKLIRGARLASPDALERFVEEARLSMQLAHGNIVPVFDFGRCDDGYYLAMEWVDGADAGALLRDGPLPPEVAAHVAGEIARALSYAHTAEGRALIHCDVKPSNVLVSRAGDVKLADFGVATLIGDPTRSGTPAYMAPEQRAGAPVDARTDLYALGWLLAEMITGERSVRPSPEHALHDLVERMLADAPA